MAAFWKVCTLLQWKLCEFLACWVSCEFCGMRGKLPFLAAWLKIIRTYSFLLRNKYFIIKSVKKSTVHIVLLTKAAKMTSATTKRCHDYLAKKTLNRKALNFAFPFNIQLFITPLLQHRPLLLEECLTNFYSSRMAELMCL